MKNLWHSWQYFTIIIIIINILFLLFFRKKLCKICQSCLKKKRLRYSTIINYSNFSHKLLDIKRAIVLGSELFKIMQCLFCCGLFVHKEGLIDRPNFYHLRVHLVVIKLISLLCSIFFLFLVEVVQKQWRGYSPITNAIHASHVLLL